MFPKTHSLIAATLVSLILCVSARSSSADEPDQTPDNLSKKTQHPTIAEDELFVILKKAAVTQHLLHQITAVFRVTYEIDVNQLPEAIKHTKPNLTYNDGHVTGTLSWLRNGVNRRLERRFDIPKKYMMHEYENFVFVDDGEKQVHFVPRTNQIAIVSSGEISSMTPTDWLQPGFRQDFGELIEDPEVAMKGYSVPDGRVRVRIKKQMGFNQKKTINAWLSPDFDYAVVEWRCDDWESITNIEYRRDDHNNVLPVKAVWKLSSPDQTREAKIMTLETESIALGPPDPSKLTFQFKPGMIFADNRYPFGNSRVKTFRVGPDGTIEEINPPAKQHGMAQMIGLGAIAIIGLVLAIVTRVFVERKRRRAID